MPVKNYYSDLGVSQDATLEDIKRAYRKLVFRYHPDHNKCDTAGTDRFRKIKEAWEVLSDPIKRRHHDATLRSMHVYAPSYAFGKYSSSNKPQQEKPHESTSEPEPERTLWQRLAMPLIFAIIAVLLSWLIISPPRWLHAWVESK